MTNPAILTMGRATIAGVILKAEGDRLRFEAPNGLTAELRADLAEHKAEILAILSDCPDSRSGDFTADDCPAWVFDESLSISSADYRQAVAEYLGSRVSLPIAPTPPSLPAPRSLQLEESNL